MMPLDLADAYYNYRLDLRQRGFFVPFNANVFVEETAVFLDDLLESGVVPVALDSRMGAWIGELNRASALQRRGHKFVGFAYGDGFIGIARGPRK